MKKSKKDRSEKNSSLKKRGPFLREHPLNGISLPDRKAYAIELGQASRSRSSEILSELKPLVERIEPFITLAVLQTYALMKSPHNLDEPRAGKVQQGHLEFLQAMLLAHKPGKEKHPPSPEEIQKLFDLLPELFQVQQTVRLPQSEIIQEKESPEAAALKVVQEYLRAHTSVVRNWGFFETMKRISIDQFRPIDDEFRINYGLNLTDVVRLFDYLIRRMEKQVNSHWRKLHSAFAYQNLDEIVDRFFEAFPFSGDVASWASSIKREAPNARGAQAALLPLADRYLTMRFFLRSQEIAEALKIEQYAVEKILSKLSLKLGEIQDADHFLQNPVWTKPLIKLNEKEYFCALPQSGISFIYKIAEELLQEFPKLSTKLSRTRSDYLEAEVKRLLAQAFPNADISTGYKWWYEGKEFETDLVLRYDTAIILVEAKSGKVTWPALRGAPERIIGHVKSLIVEPSDQSGRLSRVLQQEIENRKSGKASTLDFPLSLEGATTVLRLSVTLHDFATIQSIPTILEDAGLLTNEYPLAPCMSLADLEVMLDLLEQPYARLHYIKQRAASLLTYHLMGDELEILGLYLDTGLNLSGFEPRKYRLITAGYSAAIDRYYTMRDEGVMIEKPTRALTSWFESLCCQISERPTPGWSEMTSALLSTIKDDQLKIERNLRKIALHIKGGHNPPNGHDAIILCGQSWTNTALVLQVRRRNIGQRANEQAENLASITFEQHHIERCCVIIVDANSPNLPYIGGSVWYRKDRPVPAMVFL